MVCCRKDMLRAPDLFPPLALVPGCRSTSLGKSSWSPPDRGQASGGSLPCSGGDTYRALWPISFQISFVRGGFVLRLLRKLVSQNWDRFFVSKGRITSHTAGCHFFMLPTVCSSKKRCEGAEIFRILEV